MLDLFREIAKYGPITIEAGHGRWWAACQVILPGQITRGIVKTSGYKLFLVMKDLIIKAKSERTRLLRELASPKQQKFQYGTGSGWKNIV